MKRAAFHPAGDRDELAGDVAGQLAVRNTIVREIRSTCAGSSRPARHRRVRPAGRDAFTLPSGAILTISFSSRARVNRR